MKGTRPLDNNEIRKVADSFDGVFATRNRGLFVLGISTGGRISELLSLKVEEVWQNGTPVTDLLFDSFIWDMMSNWRVVRLAPDVADAFPTDISVNEALRSLLKQ